MRLLVQLGEGLRARAAVRDFARQRGQTLLQLAVLIAQLRNLVVARGARAKRLVPLPQLDLAAQLELVCALVRQLHPGKRSSE